MAIARVAALEKVVADLAGVVEVQRKRIDDLLRDMRDLRKVEHELSVLVDRDVGYRRFFSDYGQRLVALTRRLDEEVNWRADQGRLFSQRLTAVEDMVALKPLPADHPWKASTDAPTRYRVHADFGGGEVKVFESPPDAPVEDKASVVIPSKLYSQVRNTLCNIGGGAQVDDRARKSCREVDHALADQSRPVEDKAVRALEAIRAEMTERPFVKPDALVIRIAEILRDWDK